MFGKAKVFALYSLSIVCNTESVLRYKTLVVKKMLIFVYNNYSYLFYNIFFDI